MNVDQFWVDFLGVTSNKNRPMPLVEAIPLRLWICTPLTKVPIETSKQSSQTSLDFLGDSSSRKGSVDSNRIPQPSSAASSPGCQRAHHVTIPSSFHASVSSPNLKGTNKDDFGRTGDKAEIIGSPPVVSSLPASPRFRDSGFSSLSESKAVNNDNRKSPNVDCLSQTLSDSLDKVANGDVTAEDCLTLDRKSSHDSLDGKLSPMCIFTEHEAQTGKKSPGTIPNGGSNVSAHEGPSELRKTFGSCSSNEDDQLGAFPMDDIKVADMSVLALVPVNVNIQMDHFQFLFLMRLQEMIVKLQEQLDIDRQHHIAETCDKPTTQGSPRVTFSVLGKRAEVNIILPPSPDPALNTRGASSASSFLDPGFVSDNEIATPDVPVDIVQDKLRSDTPDLKNSVTVADVTSGLEGRGSALSMSESTDGWLPQDGDKNVLKTRRGSDASCASSQLGTSVDSRSRSSSRGSRSSRVVSVFTAEGNDIHFGLQMDGDDMAIKLTVQELKIDEKGNLNFEKYLNQKSFKTTQDDDITVPKPLPSSPPTVSVRAEFGPGAERNTPSAGERGFAHVLLSNVGLSLFMSNIEGLSECFDDEILLPKMPFFVEMKSSSICVKDDKPPRLLSAIPPLPLNVTMENIAIYRNQDEVINIRPLNILQNAREPSVDERDAVALHPVVSRQLSRTTSDLSLAESVSSRSDNDSEKECLKAQLSVSRAALHAVQDERQALLKTIERLQYELSMSNREQDRLQAKVVAYQSASSRRK